MAFSINEFISNGIEAGGARPNLFRVELFFPLGLGAAVAAGTGAAGAAAAGGGVGAPDQTAGHKAMFTCMAASLPGSIIEPVNIPYFGRVVKFKGDRQYRDWNITVFNDEDFLVRDAFETWHNTMNYPESNVMDGAYQPRQQYKTNCQITQFAKTGDGHISTFNGDERGIKTYTMIGSWPTTIGEIQMNWGDRNSVETFDVTLTYDYWLPIPAGGSEAEWLSLARNA
jgi:hypothetical protein